MMRPRDSKHAGKSIKIKIMWKMNSNEHKKQSLLMWVHNFDMNIATS